MSGGRQNQNIGEGRLYFTLLVFAVLKLKPHDAFDASNIAHLYDNVAKHSLGWFRITVCEETLLPKM